MKDNLPILVLDMDGVVVHRDKVFSIRFSEKYKVPLDTVLPFFKNEFQKCLVGKADLKVEIKKYFIDWGYKGTADELLDFWFSGEKEIDKKVIELVTNLRKSGVKVCVATNNEEYRVRYLSQDLGLEKHFDKIYSSSSLRVKKPSTEFFKKILLDVGVKNPSNVYFCDNDKENIEGARLAGLQTHFFKSFEEFRQWVDKI